MITKIMINGRSLAGKDTIADYLIEKYDFNKINFAKGIYEIAEKYLGMKIKDRFILQSVGEKMREIDPLVWVNYTYRLSEKYDKIAISDLRRENEYLRGLKEGYLPIRITADFDLRVQRAIERDGFYPDTSLWENESETGADPFDYIEIENNGTLEDLHKQIEDIIHKDHTEFMNYLYDKYKNKL